MLFAFRLSMFALVWHVLTVVERPYPALDWTAGMFVTFSGYPLLSCIYITLTDVKDVGEDERD